MSEESLKKKGRRHALTVHGPHPAHSEEAEGWLISYADMMTLLVGFFVILLSFSKIDDEKFERVKQAATKQFGGHYQEPFGELADRIRAEMDRAGLGDLFVIKQSELGLEISFQGAVFFDTGSADLKGEAAGLLSKLIPVIKAEATNFKIVIEGHTDDVPISASARYRSNWELSGVRASRVLEVFDSAGFQKTNLTAVGYADAYPVVPNRDPAGNSIPANQSQNRRVVIKVLKDYQSVLGVEAPEPPASPVPSQ